MPFPPHVTNVLAFPVGNVSPMLEIRMLRTTEVKQLAWEHSSRTEHNVGSVHCVRSGWPSGRGPGILSEDVRRKDPHLLTGPREEHKELLFQGPLVPEEQPAHLLPPGPLLAVCPRWHCGHLHRAGPDEVLLSRGPLGYCSETDLY